MKLNKKAVTLLVSLLLALTVTVGGTLAFLADGTEPLTNVFDPSQVTTQVTETFDGTTKSNVKITNTGNTEAYIRAAVVITWKDAEGNVYGQMPVVGTDYEIDWGSNQWDTETNDGFYYYKMPVATGASTENLFDSVTAKGTAPTGYTLNVEIIGSGIQSKPDRAVEEAWGVTVHTAQDGSKTISK